MTANDSLLPYEPEHAPNVLLDGVEELSAAHHETDELGGKAKLPKNLRTLFIATPIAGIGFALAFASTSYFPAIQLGRSNPEDKETLLAVLTSVSAVAAMLAGPIVGYLSDRTRSRFGRRKPWVLVGLVGGLVGILTAGLSPTFAVLVIGVALIQFGFVFSSAPFNALMPDRVPRRFRGRLSTLMGLATLVGAVLGPLLGSMFINTLPLGYLTFGGIAALGVIVILLIVPPHDNRDAPAPDAFSVKRLFGAFTFSVRRNPDMAWAFANRFLILASTTLPTIYGVYIFQEYVGMSLDEAARLSPLVGVVTLPIILIVISIVGPLTDRIGRRKPTVLISGLLMAAAALVPMFSPTVAGLFIYGGVSAVAAATFIATDQALISEVLPDEATYAKDLGVLGIAATLPNILAPALAGVIVVNLGYFWLYPITAFIALVGALCVIPIKSTR